jgi:hypothetical protein
MMIGSATRGVAKSRGLQVYEDVPDQGRALDLDDRAVDQRAAAGAAQRLG